MKFFRYLYYFFYIAFNWNVRLAFFVLYYEIRGEKKYKINTTGFDELKKLQKKGIDISHATMYMPVSYYLLNKAFRHIAETPKNNFVDIGCGKGRALCVAAREGFNKVTGVELSPDLCNETKENLERTKSISNHLQYELHNMDAAIFDIPSDANCIFFFNPFDEVIMSEVVNNIKKSLKKAPRNITVIYANPLHKDLLIDTGFQEKYHTRELDYLEMSILKI